MTTFELAIVALVVYVLGFATALFLVRDQPERPAPPEKLEPKSSHRRPGHPTLGHRIPATDDREAAEWIGRNW